MKRRILSWILAACLTVGMVTVAAAAPTPTEAAQSETMQTAASPWEKVSFVDIYNDPNKFSTISNAENGNVPKIDESVQSLGWLGTGACVAVKGFGFGAGIPDGVQLKVEMSRDLGEIEGAYHFAVYAVPSGQSVTGAGDLTEGQKIAVQPVLPPSQDHTRYFVQTYDVPAEILQAPVDLYFLCGTGGFNLKSVQFTRPQTPITVDKENAMIYTEAASQFDQALPLGNGFVGAMVYGGVDTERIGLNEATIWTGSPYENNVEGAYQALEQLRQQTANGAASWTGSFIDGKFMDATAYGPTFTGSQKYQLAGELNLKTGHAASEYVRYLDLDTATAVTQYRWDDSLITREYFVSNPDRVMAMRLTSDGAPMTFTGSYDLKGMVERGRTVEGNDTLVIQGGVSDYRTVESGIAFTVRVKFLPADGELSTEDNTITVSNTTDCTVLVTIATNFKAYNDITGDADALAKDAMDAADDKSYEELKSAHIADYQALYNRVELDLGGSLNGRTVEEARQALADRDDPAFVELSYNFNRYLQIAASREGTQPTNLQGIWNEFDAALGQGETDCTASAALRVTGQQPEGASEFSLCLKEASGVATAAVAFTTTENDVRVTGRNGFTAFGMKSKDLRNGTFEKTVYLSYLAHPGENFCCTTETEVAAIWVGRERATVTIQSMAISGYDVSGTARPGTVTGIDPDTATGGAMLDVTEAQRYYRAEAGDANWDEAMAYDTNDDQRIDLLDLTHILLTGSEASTEA